MQKVRYETDPYNRLVVNGSGKKSGLTKFRKVLDGRFKTDKHNNLTYHVKAPLSNGEKIPHQIKLKGEWELTDDHNLRLLLDKSGRETFGDQITLQGDIVKVDESSLSFAITTVAKENKHSTYVLNLEGWWKADENNRLTFHARREKSRSDILTFNGAWEIGKIYQIVYEYEKADLIRKKRRTHRLVFKGYWVILDRFRISYLLGRDTGSAFDFETSAGVFKEDRIQYEIGIGLTDRRKKAIRALKLFGRWNLKKGAGLIFEVRYENNKVKVIVFGAEAKITDRGTISFRLKSEPDNRDMGVNLKLSRRVLKDGGEVFLRALTSRRESALYIGGARRW